ncbi:hypothetical protein ACIRU3_09125 [Streptomyces sp. NPDC101151]|uniref:hypothetical protein n=1 Tax=Streptomyces sp. NPDC101151 TaxID=3366115 RepID=UPI0038221B7D
MADVGPARCPAAAPVLVLTGGLGCAALTGLADLFSLLASAGGHRRRVAAAPSHHTEARKHYRQAAEVADTVGRTPPEVLYMPGLPEKAVESVLEAVAADR